MTHTCLPTSATSAPQSEHAALWDLSAPTVVVLSTLGCTLALPGNWRIERRTDGIFAAPHGHAATDLPPLYEFRTCSAAVGIHRVLRECIASGATTVESQLGRRRVTLAHGAESSAHPGLSVYAVGELYDHRRSCAVHVVREWSNAAVPAETHALRIWRNAPVDLHGEAQHWISEAARLHVTLPRSWTIDVHEAHRLVARVNRRVRSRPNLVVDVVADPQRPRSLSDMTAICGRSPQPWIPMRFGNRPALRRTLPIDLTGEEQTYVHQIVPEPGVDASVYVELVSPRSEDEPVAEIDASRTRPGFHWHEFR